MIHKTRILFISQNSSFSDFFETFVSHPFIEFIPQHNLDMAMQVIEKEQFDILVVDQELKKGGVYEIMNLLKHREQVSPLLVVLYTDTTEKNLVDLYSNGVHVLVPKPILNLSFAYQLSSLSKMIEMRKKRMATRQALAVIDTLDEINAYLHKDIKQACEKGLTRLTEERSVNKTERTNGAQPKKVANNSASSSESSSNSSSGKRYRELVRRSTCDYARMLALVNTVGEQVQNTIVTSPSKIMHTIDAFDDLYEKNLSLVRVAYSITDEEYNEESNIEVRDTAPQEEAEHYKEH